MQGTKIVDAPGTRAGGRGIATLSGILMLVLTLGLGTIDARGAQGPQSVADLAEKLTAAVVNISSSQRVNGLGEGVPMPDLPPGSPFREFFEDFMERQQEAPPQQRVQSLGSGFVIDPAGIVVTNNHVIADADEIEVNLADGRTLPAKIIGRDPKTDIALLQVESEEPLHSVEFGDSEKIRVGDWVMAIGNPFGLGGTVTIGIVSARNRSINAGPYDDFIQTDAAINRGNSGGPLFDMNGQVIGINTAIISPSGGSIGIGFAVPVSIAWPVIEQLRQYGETRRGWLGVRIQTVTEELAESLGLDKPRGALVADVTPGGPAEASDIQPGDVIVNFDGREITEMRYLPRIVADTEIGKTVNVTVIRKGEEKTVQVKIGRLEEGEILASQQAEEEEATPEDEPPTGEVDTTLGLKLAPLTPEMRERFGINESVNGVVVTEVEAGSAAQEKRITAGDVIIEVGQERVASPEDVVEKLQALEAQGRKSVLLLLSNKDGELRFTAIRLADASTPAPAPDPGTGDGGSGSPGQDE